jgi:tetratricopeptide (TPR) repeat protein
MVLPLAGRELNPEQIHEKVSPSVVFIRDIESHGSGVVLTSRGMVITNYHVVASGLPLTVTAKVSEKGKFSEKTFENVRVSKVHKEYDLALLELNAPDVVFAPAELLRSGESIKTGSVCYAIGNPGGIANQALVASITQGLVSAASRKVEGLDYIQTSAALNPGNSGGAISNASGKVIGIATWKLDEADNIGFAIPLRGLDMGAFQPLTQRKPDFEAAKKFETEANRYAGIAQQLEGEDREIAIHIAAFFYRKCMEAMPNDPASYNNVGAMYFRLMRDDVAKLYFERALQIDPDYPASLSMLGIVKARHENDNATAMRMWFKGASSSKGSSAASDCAENLAVDFVNAEDYARAAYCIKWANVLAAPPSHRKPVRDGIWERSIQKLTEKQFVFLRDKNTGFSQDDLKTFASGNVSEVSSPATPSGQVQMPNRGLDVIDTTPDTKPFIELGRKMMAKAIEVPASGLVRPLPAKPDNVIMGYAGTCLLMHFKELNKIAVFDLCQAKIVKYITLEESDAVFAAGGQVLLVHLPKARKFQLWNMSTWELGKEISLRTDRRITALGMGLLNHKFAIALQPEAQNSDKVVIMSLPGCEMVTPKLVKSHSGMELVHLFGHMGVDSGYKVILEETGGFALLLGAGRGFMKLGDMSSIETNYIHGGGREGDIVIGGSEVVMKNYSVSRAMEAENLLQEQDKTQRGFQRYGLSKVHGYRGIVEVVRNQDEQKQYEQCLRIRSLPGLNEVFRIPLENKTYNTSDNELFASAYVKRCAIVNKDKKSVTVFSFDVVTAAAPGIPTPGKLFTRKLNFGENVTAKLEEGPKDLTFDEQSNEIRWEIPADQGRGSEISAIFLLTKDSGEQSYHVEKIMVR